MPQIITDTPAKGANTGRAPWSHIALEHRRRYRHSYITLFVGRHLIQKTYKCKCQHHHAKEKIGDRHNIPPLGPEDIMAFIGDPRKFWGQAHAQWQQRHQWTEGSQPAQPQGNRTLTPGQYFYTYSASTRFLKMWKTTTNMPEENIGSTKSETMLGKQKLNVM